MNQHRDYLKQNPEISIKDFEKILPEQNAELFKRRKRFFNIMVPFSGQNCQEVIKQIIDQYEIVEKKIKSTNDIKNPSILLETQLKQSQNIFDFQEFNEIFQKDIVKKYESQNDEEQKKLLENFQLALQFYWNLKVNKTTEVYVLLDSYTDFINKYKFMEDVLNKIQKSKKVETYPNIILEDQIYLGKYQQAENIEILKNLGITHIINMTKEVPNYFENHNSCLSAHLQLSEDNRNQITNNEANNDSINDKDNNNNDNPKPKINDYKKFSNSQIENPKILIHCAQGKSRSATIVIMYLMKKYKLSYKQAHDYVKSRRDCIDPNFGFQTQLNEFENNDFEF